MKFYALIEEDTDTSSPCHWEKSFALLLRMWKRRFFRLSCNLIFERSVVVGSENQTLTAEVDSPFVVQNLGCTWFLDLEEVPNQGVLDAVSGDMGRPLRLLHVIQDVLVKKRSKTIEQAAAISVDEAVGSTGCHPQTPPHVVTTVESTGDCGMDDGPVKKKPDMDKQRDIQAIKAGLPNKTCLRRRPGHVSLDVTPGVTLSLVSDTVAVLGSHEPVPVQEEKEVPVQTWFECNKQELKINLNHPKLSGETTVQGAITEVAAIVGENVKLRRAYTELKINLDHPKLSGETTVQGAITEVATIVGENVKLRRGYIVSTSSHGVVSSYLHKSPQPGLGRLADIVTLESEDMKVLLDALHRVGSELAMH
ncbi:hypothetical protein IFM89_011856, partial [Coptis chinensis]